MKGRNDDDKIDSQMIVPRVFGLNGALVWLSLRFKEIVIFNWTLGNGLK